MHTPRLLSVLLVLAMVGCATSIRRPRVAARPAPAVPAESASAPAALPADASEACESAPAALDFVFVLDVSTSMEETALLRRALVPLLDEVSSRDLDARFGLTTFENDVVVHGRGAFLERDALLAALDSQLLPERFVPDPDRSRQLLNLEPAENLLDALHRSATDFGFRSDARRIFFVMTDDTFLEPPAVYSDGSRATWSYAEVAETLASRRVRLYSAHQPAKGRGLSAELDGRPGLVDATGGAWRDLRGLDDRVLAAWLRDLVVRPECGPGPDPRRAAPGLRRSG